MTNTRWIEWAQRLQALAQSGITYSHNPFELERYHIIEDIAVEMLSANDSEDFQTIKKIFMDEAGYATPKLDIRGVVYKEDKILLVRELSDGGWTLPGGWVDINESPSHAVEREVWEESGYKVKADKLLALYDRRKHGHPPYLFHLYKLYFRCNLIGGTPMNSHETADASFFAEDNLPPLSIGRTTPEVLQRMFFHLHHPDLPTEFD